MMTRISGISRRAALAASAGVLALAAAHGAAAQEAAAAQEEFKSDVIVVTAQKRTELLSEVPQSITVVSGETLERQQADNFEDYLALVPGLSLTGETRGVSRISLRGINTGGVASTVGIYLDEVPFGSSSGLANGAILAGDFDTFDVERVEVLRGPQGTLYGASSLGGVLRFVTTPPNTRAFEGKAQVGIESVKGGDLGYSATGVINVPLSDKVAIRASGYYRFDDGFIDTIGNNPIFSIPLLSPSHILVPGTRVADNFNEVKVYGGRVSALFKPSETLSLRLTAMAQNTESAGSSAYEADLATREPLYGGLTQSLYHPETTDIKYRVYSGTLDWDLGFANLLSSTSYGTFEGSLHGDAAFAFAPTISLLAELGPLAPLLGFPVLTPVSITRPLSVIQRITIATDKFTQEVRLASPDNDTFEWLVGAYYTHEKSALDPQQAFAVEAGTETIAPDIPILLDSFLKSTFEEYAGFANATWHISPRFDLAFGGRLSHNKQNASQSLDGYLTRIPPSVPTAFEDVRSSESVFTWSVAPRFEVSDNTSIYARVATGYRPGGPNVLPPPLPGDPVEPELATYDADSLTSYEVGLKADWLDRTLSLDVAAYYLDWQDIQLFAVVRDTGINTNGGTAVSKGVEFTATARPTQGLSIAVNGAYTDAYLTEDTPVFTGGFDGDPLPYVPKWSLNVNADYEWALSGTTTAFVGASLSHVGDRTANFGTRDADGEIRKVPSFETVDLRAGVDGGHWTLQVYARNLFNERGATSVTGGPGVLPNNALNIGVIRPRTIGLTVGAKF